MASRKNSVWRSVLIGVLTLLIFSALLALMFHFLRREDPEPADPTPEGPSIVIGFGDVERIEFGG